MGFKRFQRLTHDQRAGFLGKLARDESGNTLAMIAAALVPLLAMVGGGVDMGRSYLSQTRLQQACDAGVLAARKKLGSEVVVTGVIPADTATVGNKFFNVNFQDGSYGTSNRAFQMTLENDLSITGTASVDVPTTIMNVFGYSNVDVAVECQAKLNFSNTDIMFVLDTTGSMNETNPSDSEPRINILRTVVKSFHGQLEGSKTPGTRVRYGFVPYSTNVNVGALLEDDWVVDDWEYQSREVKDVNSNTGTYSDDENWVKISGDKTRTLESTYAATYHAAVPGSSTSSGGELGTSTGGGGTAAYYSCDNALPPETMVSKNKVLLSTSTEPYPGPPAGTKTIEHYTETYDGVDYWTNLWGTTCQVYRDDYDDEVWEFDWTTVPTESTSTTYRYRAIDRSVANWRTETTGCIEERDTYEINDWDNVDLNRALDLDIDTVPTAGDKETQWRPMYPSIIYERELSGWNNSASFNKNPVNSDSTFFQPTSLPSLVACPTASRKLAEMTAGEVATYVDGITPAGTTYHDIGMIWGGRLISPTGLFEAENEDEPSKSTSRHLIFLTDGETETFDIAYGAYGVEPLDQRRWRSLAASGLSLDEVVEKRFGIACDEVKKRNITVWVIGFGVGLNPTMTACAGPGRFFEADDASELQDVFSNIAAQMGDLRVSK